MSSLIGGSPKVAPTVVEEVKPEVIDNSAKTQEEERRRRRRQGAASQFLSGQTTTGGINTTKTTLGA